MTFSNIQKDLDAGIEKIRWFARLLSERVRIELTVFQLLYRSEDLKKQRDEQLRKIGERVYDLREGEKDLRIDSEVRDVMKEIETLETQIRETIEKASEISRIVS
jgi:hypothetical protein